VGNQAMNLLLKLSIDFVQQIETEEMVTDENLVPIVECDFID
jgi:hypothetical protein